MKFFFLSLRKKASKGFSVIELVIAIGIIMVVLLAAVDIMLKIFQAQDKAVAVKDVFDNARFSMELMTREMRTATNIRYMGDDELPPSGCPSGLEYTSHNQGSAQERYYFVKDTNIDADSDPDTLMRVAMTIEGLVDCTLAQELTSPEVRVMRWGLSWSGDELGPTDGQPRWTITMTIDSRNPRFGSKTQVNLETTVAPIFSDL